MITTLIMKSAVPGFGGNLTPELRVRCGVVSGITGIVCNVLLAVVKIVLAVISGSIAVAADAVNNLSDAGSGIIMVAGFHLSSRPPDAEHPFGHGRMEYVAGLVVSVLIMGLGITFLKDSFLLLFERSTVSAHWVTTVIFASSILVKCWMFFFYRKVGKMLNSEVIKAAAYDSLSDCLGTGLVVISLALSGWTDFPVDGCAGILVALLILWAGGNVLKETVSKLLGEPPEPELVEKVRSVILNSPGIDGVHDIIIHNYGKNSYYVTAHAEISNTGDRFSAHDILENAEVAVSQALPVHLLLHPDPYNTDNPEVIFWRSRLETAAAEFDSGLKIYDFRLVKNQHDDLKKLSFHLLVPHNYGFSESEIKGILQDKMSVHHQQLELDIIFQKSFV